jgi:hypothetical protein
MISGAEGHAMLRPKLPAYDHSLVVRTDFSDDAMWERVCQAMQAPQTEHAFRASVECISDPVCANLAPELVASVLPNDPHRLFAFLVDSTTIAQRDQPLVVVDLSEQSGRTFRVTPSAAWAVENNLRLANISFDEFAVCVGPDGVFRGFPSA